VKKCCWNFGSRNYLNSDFLRVWFHVFDIRIFYMIQPIADRVAQDLEIISKTFLTNQNSAQGIYD